MQKQRTNDRIGTKVTSCYFKLVSRKPLNNTDKRMCVTCQTQDKASQNRFLERPILIISKTTFVVIVDVLHINITKAAAMLLR